MRNTSPKSPKPPSKDRCSDDRLYLLFDEGRVRRWCPFARSAPRGVTNRRDTRRDEGPEVELWREERWGAVVHLAGLADDDAELLRAAADQVATEWTDREYTLRLDAATPRRDRRVGPATGENGGPVPEEAAVRQGLSPWRMRSEGIHSCRSAGPGGRTLKGTAETG